MSPISDYTQTEIDAWHMARALELAAEGRGLVEPNPLVGCVVAQGAEAIGEGFHRRFGGPHAEINALAVAGGRAAGGTLYVTLEPCCHHGKTPPCTEAVLASGVRRVVVAMRDPFPAVSGGGIATLQHAGLEVVVGVREAEARRLNAPYLKLIERHQPWVIAKWAMTLDGKLATASGDSRWISSEASRQIVHDLRGRMDAILVGRGTADADDPLLTARPPGVRVATRVVLDTQAKLASSSRLIQSIAEAPVLVAVGEHATHVDRQRLTDAGCEVFVCPGDTRAERLTALLGELGHRRMTNVLCEGGAELLGSLRDAGAIDEVHVFIAPKIVGGAAAASPIGGTGLQLMSLALELDDVEVANITGDVYVRGRLKH